MSHLTHMKTSFQNLVYLKKALTLLNIKYINEESFSNIDSNLSNKNLIISQSNGYNVEFAWNGKEYELIADLSFWEQPYSIESFIDKVAQQYAGEVIIGESQKMGFQPIKHKQNLDGSTTLILERWNSKKII